MSEAGIVKRIGSGILSFFVVLLLLEGAARIGSTLFPETSRGEPGEWYLLSPELGWTRKPGFKGVVTTAERSFDSEGLLEGEAAKLADATKKKILFIGDSNTFGNELPVGQIFSSVVDEMLADAVTINCAVPGYSSYQGKELLKRTLQRFRPDIIVASFNYNDRRYVLSPDEIDGAAAFRRLSALAGREKLLEVLERIYIVRALRAGLSGAGFLGNKETAAPIAVAALVPRVSSDDYRRNLTEIAETARQYRIPLLFLVLRDNPVQTYYLSRGLELSKREQFDAATEFLRIAQREPTGFAVLAQLYLEKTYLRVGSREQARKVSLLERPFRSVHGGHPVRLDSDYNLIMREVGEKYRAGIVDGAQLLEQRPSVYYDFCHFDATGHRLIAEQLVTRIRAIIDGA